MRDWRTDVQVTQVVKQYEARYLCCEELNRIPVCLPQSLPIESPEYNPGEMRREHAHDAEPNAAAEPNQKPGAVRVGP